MSEEEYNYNTKHYILRFENAERAIEFANECNFSYDGTEDIRIVNKGEEAWICVLAVCDICGRKSIFFAQAWIYDEGIEAVECNGCGNMSVYPQEGSFDDA